MIAAQSTRTDPIAVFEEWMAEAAASEPNDPNAMTLATCTPDGRPAARTVLLKAVDPSGFVFYTNTESRKGQELRANPHAALLFYWKSLRRQVRIEGEAEPVSEAEADLYFATRPRLAQLGAWASDQSRRLESRSELEQRLADVERRFSGEVARPPNWSGYRIMPSYIEFWQEMPYRLHDRTYYRRVDDGWHVGKLYP
ncbi:MAG: pyridoxamine 5'-phosphate oxidase [Acetobacteraceae bacterium]|nr:pyridoxamine 5'-phosphate oxidase [Acetobacteraceae bacterium]MBV8591557.1 pyridoxamine 5'-phosphate oxidase [Acetobacteraceae bacterium]